jgi:hypothetical protein
VALRKALRERTNVLRWRVSAQRPPPSESVSRVVDLVVGIDAFARGVKIESRHGIVRDRCVQVTEGLEFTIRTQFGRITHPGTTLPVSQWGFAVKEDKR